MWYDLWFFSRLRHVSCCIIRDGLHQGWACNSWERDVMGGLYRHHKWCMQGWNFVKCSNSVCFLFVEGHEFVLQTYCVAGVATERVDVLGLMLFCGQLLHKCGATTPPSPGTGNINIKLTLRRKACRRGQCTAKKERYGGARKFDFVLFLRGCLSLFLDGEIVSSEIGW